MSKNFFLQAFSKNIFNKKYKKKKKKKKKVKERCTEPKTFHTYFCVTVDCYCQK